MKKNSTFPKWYDYVENTKESTDKFLELVREFNTTLAQKFNL